MNKNVSWVEHHTHPNEAMLRAINASGRDPSLIISNWYAIIDAILNEQS